jgi:hypothetical protein
LKGNYYQLVASYPSFISANTCRQRRPFVRDFIIWIGFGIRQNEQSFFDQPVEAPDCLLMSQISSVCDTCFVSAFDRWTIKDYLQDLVNDVVPGTMRLTNNPIDHLYVCVTCPLLQIYHGGSNSTLGSTKLPFSSQYPPVNLTPGIL